MTKCESFPPAGSHDPLILILGSMPGPTSLKHGEYYGHPQNAFWRIMGDLFGAGRDKSYAVRMHLLAARRIALWDTIAQCVRPGSADADMTEMLPNDFNAYLQSHANLQAIFFDGASAYKMFCRFVLPTLTHPPIALVPLPSTSPRYAAMSYEAKLKSWQVVKQRLEAITQRRCVI